MQNPPPGRPRLKDIADELQISTSTVSRALANDYRISKSVRNAVNNLAKKIGYTRNQFAFNLYRRTSSNIGLILPEFTHHYFSKALKGIDDVVKENGFDLIINTHNDNYDKERRAVKALNNAMVQGILVAYAGNNQGFRVYQDAIEKGIPIVFFDRLSEEIDASYVITDDFGGALKAVNHLVKTDCSKIAYFSGPDDISTNFNRQMGYIEGLKNGGHQQNTFVLPWEPERLRREASIRRFIGEVQPDGIFCFSDYIAYETLCTLETLGINVPTQISLIGFAGEPVSEISRPSITTVLQPAEQVGRRAAEILLWHLANPGEKQVFTEFLPTELILRGTTRTAIKSRE